eukprot:11390927-Alexandrium_andersonii.AAC.1
MLNARPATPSRSALPFQSGAQAAKRCCFPELGKLSLRPALVFEAAQKREKDRGNRSAPCSTATPP